MCADNFLWLVVVDHGYITMLSFGLILVQFMFKVCNSLIITTMTAKLLKLMRTNSD